MSALESGLKTARRNSSSRSNDPPRLGKSPPPSWSASRLPGRQRRILSHCPREMTAIPPPSSTSSTPSNLEGENGPAKRRGTRTGFPLRPPSSSAYYMMRVRWWWKARPWTLVSTETTMIIIRNSHEVLWLGFFVDAVHARVYASRSSQASPTRSPLPRGSGVIGAIIVAVLAGGALANRQSLSRRSIAVLRTATGSLCRAGQLAGLPCRRLTAQWSAGRELARASRGGRF